MTTREPMSAEQWDRFKQEAERSVELRSWEHQAAGLEALARRHFAEWLENREDTEKPEERSDVWYAVRVLLSLQAARRHIDRKDAAWFGAETLRVGMLAGNWPAAQEWRRRRDRKREAGQKGGNVKSDRATELRALVKARAETIRASTPYDRTSDNTTWLAKAIADRLGENWHTVKGHLRTLGQK